MTRTWIRTASLAILSLALLGSVAWAKPKIAVLGIEAMGSTVDTRQTDLAKELTDQLRTRAGGPTGSYQLAPNTKRELVDEKLMNGCTDEKPACMATIGANLSVEFLLYGHIERLKRQGAEGYWITAKLLNVKEKAIAETWEEFLPLAGATGLGDVAKRGYIRLGGEKVEKPIEKPQPTATKPATGSLLVRVTGSAPGARVYVDEEDRGALERGQLVIEGLKEGRYKVAVQADGFRRWEEDSVLVRGGETQNVSASLVAVAPARVQGKSKTGLVVGIAAGVVVAGLGTYLVIDGKDDIKGYDDNVMGQDDDGNSLGDKDCGWFGGDAKATPQSDPDGKFAKACTGYRKTAWGGVMIGVGGAAVVGTVLYYALRKSPEQPVTTAGRRVRKPELAITPVVSPNGGGATIRIDF